MKEKMIKQIGFGFSGQVWLVLNKETGTLTAKKLYVMAAGPEAINEYNTACKWRHPNLLHPISFSHADDGRPCIEMPYCSGRSVDDAAGFFSEKYAWQLLAEISDALACMHETGWVHSDVKPSNILWTGEKFMLADFGSCLPEGQVSDTDDPSSYRFAAPEGPRFGSSDVWSLGATVFNLVLGSYVFGGLGGSAMTAQTPVPVMKKTMPELSSLISRCLSYKPEDRPTAKEITEIARQNLTSLSKGKPDYWPDNMTD